MFTAYEAIDITPENWLPIKAKLGDEFPKWEELLKSRLDDKELFWIVFDCETRFGDDKPTHLVVPDGFLEENFDITSVRHVLYWITKRK